MKKLVLLVWVLMQIVVPTMISAELYATAVQLELAFFSFAIWYFNTVFNKKTLGYILAVFSIYYSYIYITDYFIDYMPTFLIYMEAFIVYVAIWANMDD